MRDSNIKQEVPVLDLTVQVKSEDLNPAETINAATCRNEKQDDDREFFNMTLKSQMMNHSESDFTNINADDLYIEAKFVYNLPFNKFAEFITN